MKNRMAIVLSRSWMECSPSLYDLETAAALSDMHPQLVLHYIELGLVEPLVVESNYYLLSDSNISRLRRIQRLRRDLGVNIDGVGVIFHLLDKIEELQKQGK